MIDTGSSLGFRQRLPGWSGQMAGQQAAYFPFTLDHSVAGLLLEPGYMAVRHRHMLCSREGDVIWITGGGSDRSDSRSTVAEAFGAEFSSLIIAAYSCAVSEQFWCIRSSRRRHHPAWFWSYLGSKFSKMRTRISFLHALCVMPFSLNLIREFSTAGPLLLFCQSCC